MQALVTTTANGYHPSDTRADCGFHLARTHGVRILVCMTTRTIPESPNGYSAADVLRVAHALKVPGKLIKRYRGGRELRAYPGHQADNPWKVIAPAADHYTEGK